MTVIGKCGVCRGDIVVNDQHEKRLRSLNPPPENGPAHCDDCGLMYDAATVRNRNKKTETSGEKPFERTWGVPRENR